MRNLALLTLPLLVASQANAIEFLNIDRGSDTFKVKATLLSERSDEVFKDEDTGQKIEDDPTSNTQFVAALYRQDIYEFGIATSKTTDDDEDGSDSYTAYDLKAGVLFQADDGVKLAIATQASIEQDSEKSDTVEFRVSAGRHIDQWSGEVNVSHYQASASDRVKAFSINELGFGIKYQVNQYLTFVSDGYGLIANDIKLKNSSIENDQQYYSLGVGVGSDPLPNLDILLKVNATNYYAEVFDENDVRTAELTEDGITTTLALDFYF